MKYSKTNKKNKLKDLEIFLKILYRKEKFNKRRHDIASLIVKKQYKNKGEI